MGRLHRKMPYTSFTFLVGTLAIADVLPAFATHKTMWIVCFALLYVTFAVKIPAFPFHTWLPDAHVEAPTPISMILAGLLVLFIGWGFLNSFSLHLFGLAG